MCLQSTLIKNQTLAWPYWLLNKLGMFHKKYFLMFRQKLQRYFILQIWVVSLKLPIIFLSIVATSATQKKKDQGPLQKDQLYWWKNYPRHHTCLLQRAHCIEPGLESKCDPDRGWGGKETEPDLSEIAGTLSFLTSELQESRISCQTYCYCGTHLVTKTQPQLRNTGRILRYGVFWKRNLTLYRYLVCKRKHTHIYTHRHRHTHELGE